jgi:RNA polymerase sigma factor (TIGR02999 family)
METREITRLLEDYNSGKEKAEEELYRNIYTELKKTARGVRRRWNGNHTLNTTALVHEAYMKMLPGEVDWQNRLHFFYIAGKSMRQILYNYAEKKMALKRGNGKTPLVNVEEVKEFIPLDEKSFFEIFYIENILKNLEKHDDMYGKIIECRFYSGMTIQETAKALNISAATVKRKWNFAKTYLFNEMQRAS